MAWQRRQDHDGLLEGCTVAEPIKQTLRIDIAPNAVSIDGVPLADAITAMVQAAVRVTIEACAKEEGYDSFKDSPWSLNGTELAKQAMLKWESERERPSP